MRVAAQGAQAVKHSQPSLPSASRNQAVELLRILSAFGIVGFHAQAPGAPVYYAGLVFFVLLSPLMDLLYRSDRLRTWPDIAQPLLVPWLFWMVIYGAMNLVLGKPLLPEGPVLGALLMGTAGHLWFLPFLFVVLLAIDWLKRTRPPLLPMFWFSTLFATLLLASAALWRPVVADWPLPLPQWMQAMGAVLAAISIALATRTSPGQAAAGLTLLAAGIALPLAQGVTGIGLPYALAVPLTVAAVFWGRSPALAFIRVQPVADCMFGVYLVHLITLPIASRLVEFHSTGAVVLAFMLALAGVWAARRFFPISQKVLG